MTQDTWHGIAGLTAVACITAGAWRGFGAHWGLIVLGAILLGGVIYARTRGSDEGK